MCVCVCVCVCVCLRERERERERDWLVLCHVLCHVVYYCDLITLVFCGCGHHFGCGLSD